MSSALTLLVPSLKPKRFRGVCCAREVEDVRPKPIWDQRTCALPKRDPRQVPDGMHGHLGIVGAGLDHQVPSGARFLQVVAREMRQVDQGSRPPACQAEAGLAVLLEQRRAETERQRQPGPRSGPEPRRCLPAGHRTAR